MFSLFFQVKSYAGSQLINVRKFALDRVPRSVANSPGHILIVDDEPSLLKMASAFLRRAGYLVSTSESIDAAWTEAEAEPGKFDVVLLDASMSGMTMLELGHRLLQLNPAINTIASSGYLVDISALEAIAPGRVAYLPKPFTQATLLEAIHRTMAERKV